MTLPRMVIRGSCILITRRCFGQQFLLRPDPLVVELFIETVTAAAARYGIVVLGAVEMSNHYHLVVWDKHGQYPRFVAWMNARLTRGVNRLRCRKDTMWEARQTSVVELGDAESVLEALAYVHLNPMAAGLVADPVTWPGVVTGPDDFEPEVVPGRVGSGLRVKVPPTHEHLPPGAFAALLRARIEARARWIRASFKQLGRSFGTPEDAFKVACQATPHQSLGENGEPAEDKLLEALRDRIADPDAHPEPHHGAPPRPSGSRPRSINPTVKAATSARRAAMLSRRSTFRAAYARALSAFQRGMRAIFPGGTWYLCSSLKLPSAPEPTAAWAM